MFEPADFSGCLEPDDPGYVGTEDYDSDGSTNDDEMANGTDICSGGSKPSDHDGNLISDLTDKDDDNDGIDDILVVYPNPASSQMTLGFANEVTLRTIRIYDRGGRL